mmetsp:Transcript_46796/g.92086  ORF Transcript_46796/g.92086 Transcript_46796/m.92086 type:complete len:179 (+) Transcript_46796:26-562(+)
MRDLVFFYALIIVVSALEPGRVVVMERTFEVPVDIEPMGAGVSFARPSEPFRAPNFRQHKHKRVVVQEKTVHVPVTVSEMQKPKLAANQRAVLEPMIEWEKIQTRKAAFQGSAQQDEYTKLGVYNKVRSKLLNKKQQENSHSHFQMDEPKGNTANGFYISSALLACSAASLFCAFALH